MVAAWEFRGTRRASWAGEMKEGGGCGDGVAVRALGMFRGGSAILNSGPAGNACSPVGHLLFEGTIFGKLGLQLLHDLANGHCMIFNSIAWLEGTHHVAHRECINSCLA